MELPGVEAYSTARGRDVADAGVAPSEFLSPVERPAVRCSLVLYPRGVSAFVCCEKQRSHVAEIRATRRLRAVGADHWAEANPIEIRVVVRNRLSSEPRGRDFSLPCRAVRLARHGDATAGHRRDGPSKPKVVTSLRTGRRGRAQADDRDEERDAGRESKASDARRVMRSTAHNFALSPFMGMPQSLARGSGGLLTSPLWGSLSLPDLTAPNPWSPRVGAPPRLDPLRPVPGPVERHRLALSRPPSAIGRAGARPAPAPR